MATPKPKKFYAARDFTVGRQSFKAGAVIQHGLTLQRLLRFGDKFAVSTKNSTTPVEPTANPPRGEASESTKED